MKYKLLIAVTAVFIGAAVLFLTGKLPTFYRQLSVELPQVQKVAYDLATEKISKEIVVTPPPLQSEQGKIESASPLTNNGIIVWTNIQRKNEDLLSLSENVQLDKAARERLNDMFAKQYFAHVSPSGADAASATKNAAYEFIILGENLASGNFKDNQALVQGWMNSPGHRANILNPSYREIGVAVGNGIFEGRDVWLAVQIFGLPLSACPRPDSSLRAVIRSDETQLDAWRSSLEAMNQDIEQTQPKRGPDYKRKVDEYNALVENYNRLLEEVKGMVSEYNSRVAAFNDCTKTLLPLQIGGANLTVEVADTEQERALGLSGEASLAEDRGMLFVFERPDLYSFWMKDMKFPIDIIWMDADKRIVDLTTDVRPDSFPRAFQPKSAAKYVLEANVGWIYRHDIKIGMQSLFDL